MKNSLLYITRYLPFLMLFLHSDVPSFLFKFFFKNYLFIGVWLLCSVVLFSAVISYMHILLLKPPSSHPQDWLILPCSNVKFVFWIMKRSGHLSMKKQRESRYRGIALWVILRVIFDTFSLFFSVRHPVIWWLLLIWYLQCFSYIWLSPFLVSWPSFLNSWILGLLSGWLP